MTYLSLFLCFVYLRPPRHSLLPTTYLSFPAWMDRLPPLNAQLLPYAQATPTQLSQALIGAREALDPYYPALTWPHWHRAFQDLQPLLRCDAERTAVTFQGLAELTRYFEGVPPGAANVPKAGDIPLTTRVKKTFSMEPEALEQLDRVSFWRREGKSDLVNLALTRLLATYPEAHVPITSSEDFPKESI